jgi:hypothetical protein
MGPESIRFPETGLPIDGGHSRSRGPDAVAGKEVHLHTRLLHRAQHAGMVGPMGSRAGEDHRGASLRRIRRRHAVSNTGTGERVARAVFMPDRGLW